MNSRFPRFLAAVLVTALAGSSIMAQETATAPAPADTAEATPLLSVGGNTLTEQRIEQALAELPPELPPQFRQQAANQIIQQFILTEVLNCYVKARKLPVDEKLVQEQMESIRQVAQQQGLTPEQVMQRANITPRDVRNQSAFQKFFEDALSDANAKAFVEAHSNMFDGTQARARHILIRAGLFEPTEQQQKARAKLEGIARQIRAGEVSFADAVTAHSEDPGSKETGGEYTFAYSSEEAPGQPAMVPTFGYAAFTGEPGKAQIVRTPFGWHLIEVLEIIPGDRPVPRIVLPATAPATETASTDEPAEQPQEEPATTEPATTQPGMSAEDALSLARATIGGRIEMDILSMLATDECKLAFHEPEPEPEPDTAPATDATTAPQE